MNNKYETPDQGPLNAASCREKAAYFSGLLDGMDLDPNEKTTRLFRALADVLSGMTDSLDTADRFLAELAGQVDDIDADLGDLEREVYSMDYPDDDNVGEDEDEGCGCGCGHHHHHQYHDHLADFPEDFHWGGSNPDFEVTCPSCGETIGLKEETLEDGGIVCPRCGEMLEFDIEDCDCDDDDCDDCGCGCEDPGDSVDK